MRNYVTTPLGAVTRPEFKIFNLIFMTTDQY